TRGPARGGAALDASRRSDGARGGLSCGGVVGGAVRVCRADPGGALLRAVLGRPQDVHWPWPAAPPPLLQRLRRRLLRRTACLARRTSAAVRAGQDDSAHVLRPLLHLHLPPGAATLVPGAAGRSAPRHHRGGQSDLRRTAAHHLLVPAVVCHLAVATGGVGRGSVCAPAGAAAGGGCAADLCSEQLPLRGGV